MTISWERFKLGSSNWEAALIIMPKGNQAAGLCQPSMSNQDWDLRSLSSPWGSAVNTLLNQWVTMNRHRKEGSQVFVMTYILESHESSENSKGSSRNRGHSTSVSLSHRSVERQRWDGVRQRVACNLRRATEMMKGLNRYESTLPARQCSTNAGLCC